MWRLGNTRTRTALRCSSTRTLARCPYALATTRLTSSWKSIGSKGVLWVTRCTGEMLDMPPLVLHLGNESVSYQMPMDWIESFNGAAADFVEGILEGRQPMMDAEFSDEVLRAIIAMYRSSDSGQWVVPAELS